jgi:formylglycine-generating enzyme required for sulfatase activity
MKNRRMLYLALAIVFLVDGRFASAASEAGQQPAASPQIGKDGLEYVWIPPGTFMMGCSPGDSGCDSDEKPAHRVTITKGYWMSQTEVTVAAYKRFVSATGRKMPPETDPQLPQARNPGWSQDLLPITSVTSGETNAFCRWAGGRLPTEAEWEYAARGGNPAARYGKLDDIAWYLDNSGRLRLDGDAIDRQGANIFAVSRKNANAPHPVGQKRPNAYNLYDMLGNVSEWVADWHDEHYYGKSPVQDPAGPASGKQGLVRGNSFMDFPQWVRVSGRWVRNPSYGYAWVGFRCVREAAGAAGEASKPTASAPAQAPPPTAPQQPTIELRYGSLKISIDRGGTVYLDGTKVGDVPPYAFLSLPQVAAGPHAVKVEKAGFQTQERQLEVLPEQTITLELRLVAEGGAAAPQPAPQPTPPAPQPARPGAQPAAPAPQPTPPAPQTPGTRIGKDTQEYVWIPPGSFEMGCVPGDSNCADCEKPRHRVTLSKGYWMGRTEVTVGAYLLFTAATRRAMPPVPSYHTGWTFQITNHPIVNVTWQDADNYCRWAGGRLPTEAEWERAARGGQDGLIYPWGNSPSHENANYGTEDSTGGLAQGKDRWEFTAPVTSFDANAFGLHDMAGNAWEWVADWYAMDYYSRSPAVDPQGPSSGQSRTGEFRVRRGGSFGSGPNLLRSSYRMPGDPLKAPVGTGTGFRCVLEGAGPSAGPPSPAPAPLPARSQAAAQPTQPPPPQPPAPQPLGTRIGKDMQEYVWIPPGTFEMGCVPGDNNCAADEKPRHRVTLTKGLWMGRTEVTAGAYTFFAAITRRTMPAAPFGHSRWSLELKDHPIVKVTWQDADNYCHWAGGRLPTEAEWERAARGGVDGYVFPWGNQVTRENASTEVGFPGPVGRFRANGYGLFDVAGNAAEWVADWYESNYYSQSPAQDPPGPSSGDKHVCRGGTWFSGPRFERASYRTGLVLRLSETIGFRCVIPGP